MAKEECVLCLSGTGYTESQELVVVCDASYTPPACKVCFSTSQDEHYMWSYINVRSLPTGCLRAPPQ